MTTIHFVLPDVGLVEAMDTVSFEGEGAIFFPGSTWDSCLEGPIQTNIHCRGDEIFCFHSNISKNKQANKCNDPPPPHLFPHDDHSWPIYIPDFGRVEAMDTVSFEGEGSIFFTDSTLDSCLGVLEGGCERSENNQINTRNKKQNR